MHDGEAERLTEPASPAPQPEDLAPGTLSRLKTTSSSQLQRQGAGMYADGTAEDMFDKALRFETKKVMTWEKFKTLWLELLGDVAPDEVMQAWEEVQDFGALG